MEQTFEDPPVGSKEAVYRVTLRQLESLLAEDENLVASLANTSALLKFNLQSLS
jgi:putative methionine-R-sulfoxide reductase with GAF domain